MCSGALEVRFQDRTITYQTTDRLLEARGIVANAIAAAGNVKPIRQIRVYGESGF